MQINKKIRLLRKEKRLSQEKLGALLGIHLNQVNRLEKGHTQPSIDVVKKLMTVFDVSADYLLSDGDDDISVSLVGDKELLRLFEEVSNLNDEDKQFVVKMIKMGINNSKIKQMSV
ncbi:MAG: helix-turn-helix transcriptional regulator [bacterium]|nr:helix-turn-helix transcriptional regulator [bacterium]